MGRDKI